MTFKKVLTGFALATVAVLGLAACSSNKSASSDDSKTVKVGVVNMSDTERARWDKIKELVGDKANIEFTEFTDYSQPNEALANKEIDINAFQHYNFLENWNKENNQDLVAIADTYLAPIRLYSTKVKKVSELKDGATIAIPNDPSNGSRALYVLQAAGLIKLDVSGKEIATVANIKENTKNIKIEELDASQTPRSLADVDAAIINNTYLEQANLTTDDAIFVEEKDDNSQQWINVIAARKDWEKQANVDAIKAIVDAYHTDDVKKVIKDTSSDIPQW
ncbi:MetQ/NlpA family ABC transporter substrate-binding protein [Streptococcus sp. zg-JUN1979]|uniref:MetQ/NlpA family ABC transporter substrate-binding protein n=1 Tax=Streptococcus sp. zg-JUN1979 TaxID=3391450 RepID=UPI0039A63935